MARRISRWVLGIVAGSIVLAIVGAIAIVLVSRSGWGREKARALAVSWLRDNVAANVTIGRFSGDGLLEGIIAHDITIREAEDQPFLHADSVSARYRILDLLFGRIVLSHVRLWGGDVQVVQMPGDTAWNFQRIFARPPEPSPLVEMPGRLVRFDDVRVTNSNVTVIRPFDGDPRGALGSRYVLEPRAEGTVQVMHFTGLDADVSRLIWSRPDSDVHEFQIERVSGDIQVVRDAFALAGARGTITLEDSIVGIDIREFTFADSKGSASGRVITGDDGARYDLRVDGESVELSDLPWLDPRIPSTGNASFVLRLATQPDGSLLLGFQDIVLKAPATNVSGSFGFVAATRPALRDVDLRLAPLDLGWLAPALPDSFPRVDGRLTGRVRAGGPLSGVQTSGDLRLSQWGGETAQAVRWSGGVRASARLAARMLNAELTDLDLEWLSQFRPGLDLAGLVNGRVDLDGDLRQGLQVRSVASYQLDGEISEFDGSGTITLADSVPRFDFTFDARPLRLATVAHYIESVDSLNGSATGPITLRGTPDSLDVSGNLRTAAGPLDFAGTIDRRTETPRVALSVATRGFEPARLGMPVADARLSGRVSLRLAGNDATSISGPVRIDLDSAMIRNLPIEKSYVAMTLGDGYARVDSSAVGSPGLRATTTGRLGLTAETTDSLHVLVDGQSFEPLENVVFGEVLDPTTPRTSGTGRANLAVRGSITRFDVTGSVILERPAFDGRTAHAVRLAGSIRDIRSDSLTVDVDVEADSVVAFGTFADSLRGRFASAAGAGNLDLDTWQADTSAIHARASFAPAEAGTDWNIDELRFLSGAGAWRLAQPTGVRLSGGTAVFEALRLVPSLGGEIVASGTLAWSDSTGSRTADPGLDFDIGLSSVPFGLIPLAVRPAGDIRGTIDGAMHVTGVASAPLIEAGIEIGNVEYEGADLQRVQAAFHYANQLMTDTLRAWLDGRVVMNGVGTIPIDLRFGPVEERIPDRPLDFTVRMDSFPAAFLLGFNSGFTNTQGVVDGSVMATGNTKDPRLSGSLLLRNGATTWTVTGVRYVRAEGTFLMNSELSTAVDISAFTAQPGRTSTGGSARLTGTIDLRHPTDPGFDLELRAERILVAMRKDAQLTASGQLRIDSSYTRPYISGTVNIVGGTLNIDELYRQYQIVQLEDPFYFDLVDTSAVAVKRVLPESQSPFVKNLRIANMNVTVGEGSWLRSREMNVEVAGELNVDLDRQADDLEMTGSLRVVRGTYRLEYPPFSRLFEVRQGVVEFPGTPGIDPNLNISAAYTARSAGEPLEIFADVTGTLQAPRVSLRSDQQPPISESDLAGYLFLGAPTYAFSNFGTSSGASGLVTSFRDQILASTLSSGLQTIGQNFGLVDYVGLIAADGGEQTGGQNSVLGGLLSNTKIELGRYITPRLFVTYTQRLDSRADYPGVRLEWRFHPTYTAELFSEDRFARAPSFSLSQAVATRRVYGFFIFREWGY